MPLLHISSKSGDATVDLSRVMYVSELINSTEPRYIVIMTGGYELTIYETRSERPHMSRTSFIAAWEAWVVWNEGRAK